MPLIELKYKSDDVTTTVTGELFGDYYADYKDATGEPKEQQPRKWGTRIGFLIRHKGKHYVNLTNVTIVSRVDSEGNNVLKKRNEVISTRDYNISKIQSMRQLP